MMFSRAAVLRLAVGLVAGLLIGVFLRTYVAPLSGSKLSGNVATVIMGSECMLYAQACNSYIAEFESNDVQGMRKWCTGTVDECWDFVMQGGSCKAYKNKYLQNQMSCMVMPRGNRGSPPSGMNMGTAEFFDWAMMPMGWWQCDPNRSPNTTVAGEGTNYLLNNMCSFGTDQCAVVSGKWLATAQNPNQATFETCPYVTNNTSNYGPQCCALNGPISCGNFNANSCAQGECPGGQTCQVSGGACACAADCSGTINEYNYVSCCDPEGGAACCDYATENALPLPAACAAPKNYACDAATGDCKQVANGTGTHTTNTCDNQCVIPCGKNPGEACGGTNKDQCCDANGNLSCDTATHTCKTITRYACDVTSGKCEETTDPAATSDKAACDADCDKLCCSPNRTCDVVVPGVNYPN